MDTSIPFHIYRISCAYDSILLLRRFNNSYPLLAECHPTARVRPPRCLRKEEEMKVEAKRQLEAKIEAGVHAKLHLESQSLHVHG